MRASSEWAYSLGSRRPTSSTTARPTVRASVARGRSTSARSAARSSAPTAGSESYDAKAADYNSLAQKIKSSGADVVFVGAITGQGTAKLWKDIKAANPDITMFGPDGVNEKTWSDGAGAAANGTYLTFGGVDISQLTGSGKTWADAYKAAHNGDPPPFYAAYGHAAAQVVLAGLQKAGTNDRAEVLDAIMGTSGLDTVIGSFTFDPTATRRVASSRATRWAPPGRPSTRASSPSRSRTRQPPAT